MAITWRTDYAMRLMYEAARQTNPRITVRELSELSSVPYDFARVIAHDLVNAGLLVSRRGVGGGVSLARPAAEITMLDVFNAMKEPASVALCTTGEGIDCPREDYCAFHLAMWRGLDEKIEEYLSSVTIAAAVKLAGELPRPEAASKSHR